MKTLDPAELLWALRHAESAASGTVPPDDELRKYRSGELADIAVRRLEWSLCRSAAARARLVELAGVRPAQPSRRTRRRILAKIRASEPARPRIGQLAAAVLFAGAMISAAILFDGRHERALPTALAFEVRIEALAPTRGDSGLDQAHADTPVRVTVEPRQDGLAGLEFALYAQREGRLEKLEAARDGLRLEAHRGAALLVAPAAALVGAAPGTREFFVVVGPEGELPSRVSLDALGRAALEGQALVYPRSITILPPHLAPARDLSFER